MFSGAAAGAEAEFGASAERHGIEEVNFTFDGHNGARGGGHSRAEPRRAAGRRREPRACKSRLMNRRYTDSPTLRRILQTLWYQVNNGQEIYVVGVILDDGHASGGTGWGAEFAKCVTSRSTSSTRRRMAGSWTQRDWKSLNETPRITHPHFTGTGTRNIQENGKRAIEDLFTKSFE